MAAQQRDEWKAERHAPVAGAGATSAGSGASSYDTRSSGGGRGGSLGKLLLFGVIGVALIGYFSSGSDQQSASASRQAQHWAEHEAAQARYEASRSNAALARSNAAPAEATIPPPTTVPPSTATPSSSGRLNSNDQRVAAAIDDVRAVVQLPVFASNGGEVLVVEGQLGTPERNLTQTAFNVGDLDLYRATYANGSGTLNIPCKQNGVCVAYNVYQGSTEQTAGNSQQYDRYPSMSLLVPSNDAANRILQDFQQLQNLQQ